MPIMSQEFTDQVGGRPPNMPKKIPTAPMVDEEKAADDDNAKRYLYYAAKRNNVAQYGTSHRTNTQGEQRRDKGKGVATPTSDTGYGIWTVRSGGPMGYYGSGSSMEYPPSREIAAYSTPGHRAGYTPAVQTTSYVPSDLAYQSPIDNTDLPDLAREAEHRIARREDLKPSAGLVISDNSSSGQEELPRESSEEFLTDEESLQNDPSKFVEEIAHRERMGIVRELMKEFCDKYMPLPAITSVPKATSTYRVTKLPSAKRTSGSSKGKQRPRING